MHTQPALIRHQDTGPWKYHQAVSGRPASCTFRDSRKACRKLGVQFHMIASTAMTSSIPLFTSPRMSAQHFDPLHTTICCLYIPRPTAHCTTCTLPPDCPPQPTHQTQQQTRTHENRQHPESTTFTSPVLNLPTRHLPSPQQRQVIVRCRSCCVLVRVGRPHGQPLVSRARRLERLSIRIPRRRTRAACALRDVLNLGDCAVAGAFLGWAACAPGLA